MDIAQEEDQESKHYVVAIGASAGGLEAIHSFFDNMPEVSNTSFIIIQHLSPDYKSLLVELVGRHTDMRVFEAEDNVPIVKNCIYVIPTKKFITISKGNLHLSDKPPAKVPNNAIDVFLYSLAKEKRELAIAVILSGTGTDGTKGIEAIKESGGLVIVQDPATSKFDGMPNSAIASGNVDLVLTPPAMAQEILNHLHEPNIAEKDESITDQALESIFDLIYEAVGHDFNYYKTPTLIRRVTRRMLQKGLSNINDYVTHLRNNPEECKQLAKDFLIGVTKFFRDKEAFEILRLKIFPALVDEKADGETIQIWVSACSTGEEAYSMAMLLDDVITSKARNLDVKIFATDLDAVHVDIASKGTYPLNIQHDVSSEYLSRHFIKKNSSYTIHPRIRKQIIFARHNLIKDPPLIKKDLVSCRNMLIYMSPILQQRIYGILLFATRKDGYIFLGSSESPTYIKNNITEVSSKWKIYRKVSDAKPSHYSTSGIQPRKVSETSSKPALEDFPKKYKSAWEDLEVVMLDDFQCCALYIDHEFEVKRAIGNYSKVLSLPNKEFKFHLLKMLPMEFSNVMSSELKKAWKTREKITLKSVRLERENSIVFYKIVIKPPEDPVHQLTLVTLMELDMLPSTRRDELIPSVPVDHEYIQHLEQELQETKYNLQLALEDQETTNEELQSSNEELLSANEELQSSNEELQSLNEELHTLNTEHQLKIRELLELNDDLNNYFRSVDIGQIFIDGNMTIRKFNPASAKMINFIDSDIGRPITHISTNIADNAFLTDVQTVLQNSITIEKEVRLKNGRNMLMRILPYLTRDRQTEGAIISFVDITTVTNLNNIIRGVFNSSTSVVIAFQAVRDYENNIVDFKIITANHTAAEWLDQPDADLRDKSIKRDLSILAANGMFDEYLRVVRTGENLQMDLNIPQKEQWLEVSAVKMMDGFVATYSDITAKKVSEQRLKKNYVELISVKENLKKLNDELETKVRERTKELTESEERFRLVAQATNDALWDWDFVNHTVWWSDTFFKMFDFGNELSAFDRTAWLENIHPDDRQKVSGSLYGVINSNETQWSEEYRFKNKSGKYIHILDRGYVLHDENGTPYRMLGSMFDLTSQKLAEREIAQSNAQREFLAESMPLIVWTTDGDENVNFANHQFEEYTGLSQENALGRGWEQVIHQDDLTKLKKVWKEAQRKKNDFQTEVRVKVSSGEHRWNVLSAKARRDENGNLVNWVITTIDAHEQKNNRAMLEEKVAQRTKELIELNAALERSNYDLQQFASVASHDLQEPLRKIHMFSKLIKDKFVPNQPEPVQYLERIMQSSQRMKSMIASVLNFSKLSAERNEFERTDLTQLVHELLEDFEIIISEKKAQIKLSDLPEADVIPSQMRQVFQNLLSNSLKFSKPDVPPLITITSTLIEENSFQSPENKEGAFIKIIVEDNGIGFEPEYNEKIFQLFQRLHSKDQYEGTGIGLAITKKIIEKHNGQITVKSQEGLGTIFEFIIPVNRIV